MGLALLEMTCLFPVMPAFKNLAHFLNIFIIIRGWDAGIEYLYLLHSHNGFFDWVDPPCVNTNFYSPSLQQGRERGKLNFLSWEKYFEQHTACIVVTYGSLCD